MTSVCLCQIKANEYLAHAGHTCIHVHTPLPASQGPHFLRPLGECRYTFISLAEMGVGNAMWCHVR